MAMSDLETPACAKHGRGFDPACAICSALSSTVLLERVEPLLSAERTIARAFLDGRVSREQASVAHRAAVTLLRGAQTALQREAREGRQQRG